MPNTITNTRVVTGDNLIVQQILLVSDGSEETNLVIYDSSAVATAIGKQDSLNSTIEIAQFLFQNNTGHATLTLKYDATSPVIALPVALGTGVAAAHESLNFSDHGGVVNLAKGTTGATGDITLTTTGLNSGDTLLLFLHVRPY